MALILLELQQRFALASNWQRHVDDEKCLPLPSDYIKPVQGFILAYKVSYKKYNLLTDQSDYRITPSYTLNTIIPHAWTFVTINVGLTYSRL